jgi:hydroxymethylbilane synthase
VAALRLATRGSPLALAQADRVRARLASATTKEVEIVVVSTSGDERADLPLREIGGEGAFSAAVDRAVAEARADVAVHSAKDLPAELVDDRLVLAAVPERGDVRDCLVGRALGDLEPGATVATGSIRRRAQLAAMRPDLDFVELRGNIARRIAQVPPGGAVVVAFAALERLDCTEAAAEVFETETMLPQVGQGALALTCRADDARTRAHLEAIDATELHEDLDAERAFLAALGAGCSAPLGAFAHREADVVVLEALLARPDGSLVLREERRGSQPTVLGRELAASLLAAAQRSGYLVEMR